jgi:glucoamylase
MEQFANQGGMITEQLWDMDDLPERCMKRGLPTGAAMPLCWSHAEYISLVRSRHDGVCFDRVDPAYKRYVENPVVSQHEIWSVRHPIRRLARGKTLRMIVAAEAEILWSIDGWKETRQTLTARQNELRLWFADFSTAEWGENTLMEFTIYWKHEQRWEGRNWQVAARESTRA